MGSTASFKKHPIHPMLLAFPIALWIFSLVSDFIFALGMGDPVWKDVALYSMIGGLIGALAAAIPGYIDYRSLTDRQTMTLGWWHMVINLTVVGLYALNLVLRLANDEDGGVPVFLSVIGVSMLSVSGWLGGELVYVHGAGVETAGAGKESDRDRTKAPARTRVRAS